MNKLGLLLMPFVAAAASPAGAPTVRIATAAWDEFPQVRVSETNIDYSRLSRWAEEVLATPECRAAKWRPEKFDIDARYAVLVDAGGAVREIVIKDMGCPGLNTLVASTVHEWAQKGKIPVGRPASATWFGGRLAFAGSQQSQ